MKKEVFDYENENVVQKFLESFALEYEEAKDIFKETKRWLWACYYLKYQPQYSAKMTVSSSILIIHEMWHTFIFFTKDYSDFCHTFFSPMLPQHI